MKKVFIALMLLVGAHAYSQTINLLTTTTGEKLVTMDGVISGLSAIDHKDHIDLNIAVAWQAGDLNLVNPEYNQNAYNWVQVPSDTGVISLPFTIYVDNMNGYGNVYLRPGDRYFYFVWYFDSLLQQNVMTAVDTFRMKPTQAVEVQNITTNFSCNGLEYSFDLIGRNSSGFVMVTGSEPVSGITLFRRTFYSTLNDTVSKHSSEDNLDPDTRVELEFRMHTNNGETDWAYHYGDTDDRDEADADIDVDDIQGLNVKLDCWFEPHCAPVNTELYVYKVVNGFKTLVEQDGPVNRGSNEGDVSFEFTMPQAGNYLAKWIVTNDGYPDEETEEQVSFTVFEISTGISEVLVTTPANEFWTVKLMDVSGRQLKTAAGTDRIAISRDNLPVGMYFLTLTNKEGKMHSRKVMLN